jgi:O-methyltransferase domain/Dimerisation domain
MTDATHIASEAPGGPEADAARLMDLLLGHVRLQTLHAVAALHIADHLADGPRTADEVAERERSQPRATYRLMRAAASLGVLTYAGDRRFGLTGTGQLMRDGVPGSVRNLTLTFTGNAQWQAWSLFPDAVRAGTSQAKRVLGVDAFDYYARPENAGEARVFAGAMADLSALTVQGAVAAIDTAGVSSVVDVGGADGQFVLALMAARPGLRGAGPRTAARRRRHPAGGRQTRAVRPVLRCGGRLLRRGSRCGPVPHQDRPARLG